MKRNLELIGLVLAVVMSTSSVATYFIIIPYRLDAQEARSKAIEENVAELAAKRTSDHELLTRIEERLIAMQKTIERK